MRILFILSILLTIQSAEALEIRWYGAGTLVFEDDKSRLIIDPFLSRHSMWKVITNQELTSDEKLVAKHFGVSKKETIILVTHTHFDHILELPTTAKLNPKAKIYGPIDLKSQITLHKISEKRVTYLKEGDKLKIGKFHLKAWEVKHSTLPMGFEYARGKSNLKKNAGAHDFKIQNNLGYQIEYNNKTILLHPTAEPRSYKNIGKVDLLIVSLTNRDISRLQKEVIEKLKAKQVYAIHHDNFFVEFDKPLEKMPTYPTLGSFPKGKLPKVIELK